MQNRMKRLPPDFEQFKDDLIGSLANVEGYLSPREMGFLALMAACPTAKGGILEIGSFKGKSTIILARSAGMADDRCLINAVDPMTAPSATDPDLHGDESSFEDFQKNIEAHGVTDKIRLHKTFSRDLAASWNEPLRLLWIDGDHTYAGTKIDFDGFVPHMANRGIVALHDVLHEFEGGLRVFMENVLLSPNFGPCGFCGSIAWAQFHTDIGITRQYAKQKLLLYKKLSRLVPFVALRSELNGWNKKMYKLFRSRVPRSAVDPNTWLKLVQ